MSTIDDTLLKLRTSNNIFNQETKSPSTSDPGDILSKLRTQNENIFSHTDLPDKNNPDDIKTYPINEILKSGKFTPLERKVDFRRRGKSPSGVIDGEYNDMYRGNDEYNDILRDWETDA